VFGFWHSCIALSRAALEVSLRDLVHSAGVTAPRELRELIAAARKLNLLDGATEQLATFVRRQGNRIIHPVPSARQAGEKAAFDTLSALRGVLLHLYKASEQDQWTSC
jgi:hypothetical protein